VKNGFGATSISQIAKVAGIGKGTIYEYYESKEELILYSIQGWIQLLQNDIRDILDQTEDPETRLRNAAKAAIQTILEDEKTFKITGVMGQLMASNEALFFKHNF